MNDVQFSRRVLVASAIAIAMLAFAALFVRHPEIPLLLFGAILVAVFLDALAHPLRRLGLPRAFAVAAIAVVCLAATVGAAWLAGPQIVEQGRQLVARVPEWMEPLRRVTENAAPAAASPQSWQSIAPYVFGSLSGVFSSGLAVIGGAAAGLALAIFLALQPALYLEGALKLLPEGRRARVREVLGAIAHALRWWLVGRAVAMAIVAVMTGIALAILGLPMALSLALIAGVLTFVPYVGPILAALPAIAVALTISPQQALLVAGLYWAIQLIENYVVTPVVQGRAVSIAPALLILSQVGFGVLLGGLGLLLATPIAVAGIVAVQALYVQDVLGEPVRLLGEGETGGSRRVRRRHIPSRNGRLPQP